MSQFGSGGVKNPPWARQGQQMGQSPNAGMQQGGQMPQTTMTAGQTGVPSLLGYPQQQIFQQNQMQQALSMGVMASPPSSMPATPVQMQPHMQQTQPTVFNQMGAISYPTRQQLNTAAFSPAATIASRQLIAANTQQQQQQPPPQQQQPQHQPQPQQQQQAALVSTPNSSQKQRVFSGIVTKLLPDFGFVDDDVFFLLNVVKGNVSVGDRVLVTAVFNAYLQHKWQAVCIEPMPLNQNRQFNNYNAVPPPLDNSNSNSSDFGRRQRRREEARSRREDDADIERKKRRDDRSFREREEKERDKERPRSPSAVRKRSKSPRRRRGREASRYTVYIPKIALDLPEANVLELKKRYANMYVPSDFFTCAIPRVDVFPAHRSLPLDRPCAFHVMHKDTDPPSPPPAADAQLDPPDADYLFSAKVMLLSMPPLADIYKRCCQLAEDGSGDSREGSREGDSVHVTRLIHLLVGVRGKVENMAIGGPWSPSLDGPNPAQDPAVLIKTAIRSCKALTGIDLSNCMQWFRFLEIYYRRSSSGNKSGQSKPRIETTVIFVPDVWSCLPTQLEWDKLSAAYKQALTRKLHAHDSPAADSAVADSSAADSPAAAGDTAAAASAAESTAAAATAAADEKESEGDSDVKKEPTHHSQLDIKTMKMTSLREELEARGLSSKGIKSLLIARLSKALKTEQEKAEAEDKSPAPEDPSPAPTPTPAVASKSPPPTPQNNNDKDEKSDKKKKKEEEEKKKLDERDRALLEKRYALPESPRIIAHPSRTARSGKFDCSVTSLSVLLDYREEDTKEHFFEVSLFAELFNEMLMRDFGFRIYRALIEAPEKPKEEKDDKDKKDKDKKDKKDDKDRKDKDKDKRERDEKKDSKRDEEDDEDDEDDDDDDDRKDRKNRGKKKREKVKMVTEDPFLLLSFVYFDQSQCGYILDKDLEELMLALGLNLSRSQIKKLIQKVSRGDAVHYRKLTDKPKSDDKDKEKEKENVSKSNTEQKNVDVESLAQGNKRLLPIFRFDDANKAESNPLSNSDNADSSTTASNGKIFYKGSFLDIELLMSQMNRSESARTETEKHLAKLRSEYASLKEYSNKCEVNLKDIKAELKGAKDKLSNNESGLLKIEAKSNQYLETLIEIQKKISPLIEKEETEKSKSTSKESSESSKLKITKLEDVKEETYSD